MGHLSELTWVRRRIVMATTLVVAITSAACSSQPGVESDSTDPSRADSVAVATSEASPSPQDEAVPTPIVTEVTSEGGEDATSPSSLPAEGDSVGEGGSIVTIPRSDEEIDYGPYEEAIFGGAEMYFGSVEYTNWFYTCVAEHGFNVTVVGPAQAEVHVGEQEEAYERAKRECDQRALDEGLTSYSMYGGFPDELTLRLWYRAYVEIAAECLQDAGYSVDPPPSEDSWVENYPNVWHPHGRRTGEVCTDDPIELLIELGQRDEAAGRAPDSG